MRAFPTRARTLLAWGLALAITAWLLGRTDPEALRDAARRAAFLPFVGWVALFTGLVAVADATILAHLLARTLRPVPLRSCLAHRLASYYVGALHYKAGAGALAFLLHRAEGLPLRATVALQLWLSAIDLLALLLLATVGLAAGGGGATLAPWLADHGWQAGPWPAVALAWAAGGLAVLAAGARPLRRRLAALGLPDRAGPAAALRFTVLRALFTGLYVAMTWLTLRDFGVEVPLARVLVALPLLTVVQLLPGSMSGVGAVQAGMVWFYAQPGQEAAVLAWSTACGPLQTAFRLLAAALATGRARRKAG